MAVGFYDLVCFFVPVLSLPASLLTPSLSSFSSTSLHTSSIPILILSVLSVLSSLYICAQDPATLAMMQEMDQNNAAIKLQGLMRQKDAKAKVCRGGGLLANREWNEERE